MTSPFTKLIHSTASSVKPLGTTEPLSTATPTTKESVKTTKEFATEYPTTSQKVTTQEYVNTRSTLKSSKTPKLSNTNSTSHSITQLQDRLGAIDCDLPVLPRESRLWRGNETHELNLPVTECVGERNRGEEECSSVIVSWEGVAAIQSGDILIVRIADSSSIVIYNSKNETLDANSSHTADKRSHISVQPAVYQVTRQGHEHCDVSDGMLLDITPLDEHGAKIFTLYDKDLTEGVNLLIVVSENWGSQCVRLKVTVKSDNCGESQECSGKGVCYTNVSMEGYECQCCRGYVGSHCEDREVCNPSPCLNNGICVDLTQPSNGATYHCLCPYGYTGDRCELEYNECESSPCGNGGSCTDRVGGYDCSCTRGYTGDNCQLKVDLCSPNPCPTHRYCMDHGSSYTCECPSGFVGEECHIPATSACDNNPCAHGGTCWSGVDSFYCSCRPGYTGKLCEEDFILESVMDESERDEQTGGGSVREMRLPLGLYHDRLHNVYIAAGTLGAAIAIVGVVVTACHCRVNKTYSRLMSRLSRVTESGPPHHWLEDKRAPPAPLPPALDTTDMYYTLDFSDSQSSPLIQ
ncbi:weary isoform C [Danaus plexippus plexippus]|uniref:Weary isoform C n=1 Tax=Danaus plexippus plexippus TaxID=278856 RepID=A0A212FIY8_DANPL|nr:weary isoform C [Danaus plexippus plexippus]